MEDFNGNDLWISAPDENGLFYAEASYRGLSTHINDLYDWAIKAKAEYDLNQQHNN